MPKPKKNKGFHEKPRMCDPGMCDHCEYIGEGDFICDLHGVGPDNTVFVIEGWEPTEHHLQCKRGGHRRVKQ